MLTPGLFIFSYNRYGSHRTTGVISHADADHQGFSTRLRVGENGYDYQGWDVYGYNSKGYDRYSELNAFPH